MRRFIEQNVLPLVRGHLVGGYRVWLVLAAAADDLTFLRIRRKPQAARQVVSTW